MESTCKCSACAPEEFPSGPRIDDSHYAIRHDINWARRISKVFLNGAEVKLVTECHATPGGFVVHHHSHDSKKTHICSCCNGTVCEEVLYGAVTVEFDPAYVEANG